MIRCLYHPVYGMKVVNDEQSKQLLATKMWFSHPNDAKKLLEEVKNGERLHVKKRKRDKDNESKA